MATMDPVCRMTVEEAEAAATYDYKGKPFYFCAVMCRDRFAENPERFLNGQSKPQSSDIPSREAILAGAEKGLVRLELPIRGMSCNSCVERIEAGIAKLNGIKEDSVNFAGEKASVLYN